jgi:hypothetical protein
MLLQNLILLQVSIVFEKKSQRQEKIILEQETQRNCDCCKDCKGLKIKRIKINT